ncbi:tetratricopeptide repeat protein [Kordia periserrulae]|uniref:Tetratricopeptide repeat protein n=1 Tax=Kordia periserrulae TaxID=701523 RepID=A0A2T6BRA3_9FLAO|nr:tetratricopeptide repeat protein [Kordia periserrulae]PTX58598.1 tetratricopeptide repeat protein [Kordia periserrulae]
MKFQELKKIINENELEVSLKILEKEFENDSLEIYTLIRLQAGLLNQLKKDLKYSIINEDDFFIERLKIKNSLSKIEERVKHLETDEILFSGITSKTQKPKIFISYSWSDNKAADKIDDLFSDIGINLIRDIRDVKYTQNLKEFMKSVREQDFMLLVISEKYLKSINCMFEVIENMKETKFSKTILPVVIEKRVFDFKFKKEILNFWNEKSKELTSELNDIEPDNALGLFKELRRVKEIYRNMDEFLQIINDIKILTYEDVEKGEYKELFDKIGIEPTSRKDRIRQSRLFLKRASKTDNHKEKIERLTKSLEFDDDLVDAYIERATVFYELRMYKDAIIDLTEVIKREPKNEFAYSQRGINYRMNKEFSKAFKDFNKAIDLKKDYEEAFSNRGLVWDNLGEYNKAIDDYKKAIEINPNFKIPYNNLGFTLRKKGEYSLAIKYLDKALEIDPNYGFAYSSLCEIYAALEDKNMFLKNAELALKNNCPLADYLDDPVYRPYLKDQDFITLLRKFKHPTHIQTKY